MGGKKGEIQDHSTLCAPWITNACFGNDMTFDRRCPSRLPPTAQTLKTFQPQWGIGKCTKCRIWPKLTLGRIQPCYSQLYRIPDAARNRHAGLPAWQVTSIEAGCWSGWIRAHGARTIFVENILAILAGLKLSNMSMVALPRAVEILWGFSGFARSSILNMGKGAGSPAMHKPKRGRWQDAFLPRYSRLVEKASNLREPPMWSYLRARVMPDYSETWPHGNGGDQNISTTWANQSSWICYSCPLLNWRQIEGQFLGSLRLWRFLFWWILGSANPIQRSSHGSLKRLHRLDLLFCNTNCGQPPAQWYVVHRNTLGEVRFQFRWTQHAWAEPARKCAAIRAISK